MPIPETKLPQPVTISEPSSTLGDYGTASGAPTVINTDVPSRITKNKHFNSDAGSEAGYLSKSTHLIFMNLSYNGTDNTVRIGFQLIYGTIIYLVQFVDDAPGGVDDHHQQIYCTRQQKDH